MYAPSRHCRDARISGHTTTAMHAIIYTTPHGLPPKSPVATEAAAAVLAAMAMTTSAAAAAAAAAPSPRAVARSVPARVFPRKTPRPVDGIPDPPLLSGAMAIMALAVAARVPLASHLAQPSPTAFIPHPPVSRAGHTFAPLP